MVPRSSYLTVGPPPPNHLQNTPEYSGSSQYLQALMKLLGGFPRQLTPGVSIGVSLVTMILTNGAVVFVFAKDRDRDQLAFDQSIIRSANKDALATLGDLVEITAYWDAAYDKITDDPVWADANLGPYSNDISSVSAVFGFNENDRFVYQYVAPDQQKPPGPFEPNPVIIKLAHEARLPTEMPPQHIANFVGVGEKVYLAAAARLVPNDERERA